MKQKLQLVKEVRNWQRKTKHEDDTYRCKRDQFDEQAEDYLMLIQATLDGECQREHVFTTRWRVEV